MSAQQAGGSAGPLGPLPLPPSGALPMLSFGQGFPQGLQQQMGELNLSAQVRFQAETWAACPRFGTS